MKIVIDCIIFSLQKQGGVSLYFTELITHLRQTKRITLINNYVNNNIYFNEYKLPSNNTKIWKYKLLFKRFMNEDISYGEKYIFHSGYFRVSKQKNAINIVTVHDFMYEKYYPVLKRVLHVWQKKRALKQSSGIICVSHNTKSDLLQYHPEFAQKKIKVIHHGASSSYYPVNSISKKKVILYVSGRQYYKNFEVVPEVIKQLPDYHLIIVGGGELDSKELELLSPINGRYTKVSGISSSELNVLYNEAHCLMYPSDYEGFGLPVLEALTAGCPAVCQRSSSIPEITGSDYGLLYGSCSPNNIVSSILKLENKKYRENVVLYGIERSKLFSWSKSNEQLIDFYNQIYQDNSS